MFCSLSVISVVLPVRCSWLTVVSLDECCSFKHDAVCGELRQTLLHFSPSPPQFWSLPSSIYHFPSVYLNVFFLFCLLHFFISSSISLYGFHLSLPFYLPILPSTSLHIFDFLFLPPLFHPSPSLLSVTNDQNSALIIEGTTAKCCAPICLFLGTSLFLRQQIQSLSTRSNSWFQWPNTAPRSAGTAAVFQKLNLTLTPHTPTHTHLMFYTDVVRVVYSVLSSNHSTLLQHLSSTTLRLH